MSYETDFKEGVKVMVAERYLSDEASPDSASETATVFQEPTDEEMLVGIRYEDGSLDYVPQDILELFDFNKELNKAVESRNHADYECYMAIKGLLNNCDQDALVALLADYNGGDDEFAKEVIDNLSECIEVREKFNDEFMSLMNQGFKAIRLEANKKDSE